MLSLETRRAAEMATLIRKQGGKPFIAPSMREVPLEEHGQAFDFAERLLNNEFDCVLLLTGAGTRLLWKTILTRFKEHELRAALGRTTIVVRGPKPAAAVREIGINTSIVVPEPNTWREILTLMETRPETRVAVQEYGKTNSDLLDGLKALGKQVSTVRIYGWDMPEDTAPLRDAVRNLAAGWFGAVFVTTATQMHNLMQIAIEEKLEARVKHALGHTFLASIGPTTSEALEEYGLKPDFEPSHPKMGLLVNEGARYFARLASAPR